MSFGDVKLNLLFDNGVCRCHGLLSPARTASGDTARVTKEQECIMQRIGIWLAVKKGERPIFPNFGCCIRSYMNMPLTVSILKSLKGQIQSELEELFPEYTVSGLRLEVPARNEISIKAYIGSYPVEFLGNAASLNEMNSRLNAALKDLGMASY
jgi:phage baseplate assembly protein W